MIGNTEKRFDRSLPNLGHIFTENIEKNYCRFTVWLFFGNSNFHEGRSFISKKKKDTVKRHTRSKLKRIEI